MADNDTQTTVEQPKSGWMWIKDSKGNPSASLTFVTIAFWVTTLAYIASIVTKIGPVEFRPFDAGACAAFLGPLAALYFSRRYTDSKQLPPG